MRHALAFRISLLKIQLRYLSLALVVACVAVRAKAIVLSEDFSGELTSTQITSATGGTGQVTQMQFLNGQLYVATTGGNAGGLDIDHEFGGVWRYDYSETGVLSNATRVWDGDGNFSNGSSVGSTSLAFHNDGVETYMYLSDVANIFTPNSDLDVGVLRRVTDSNNDGVWGGAGDINHVLTDNIPIEGQHRINQIQVIGNTLYSGIGNLSTNGSLESAYSGTVAYIKDLSLLTGNTTNNVSRLAGPYATGGDPSTVDTPFTSTDDAAFRVHSSGLRNPFGVGVDGDGDLWITMNQDQTGAPDELFENVGAQEKADYGFPQENPGIPGSWGNDPDVAAAGFFNPANSISSFTPTNAADPNSLGQSTAVGGIDFATANELPLRHHKDAFIGRWVPGDLVSVDTDTATVTAISDPVFGGGGGALEVVADPFGNILVAQARNSALWGAPTGINHIYRISSAVDATIGDGGLDFGGNGVHEFDWNSQAGPNGAWSDRSRWLADYDNDGVVDAPFEVDPADQFVPTQWGAQRYAVRLRRFGVVAGTATVDQDVHIDSILVAGDMELEIASGMTMQIDNDATFAENGILQGTGDLLVGGALAPGDATDGAPFGGDVSLGELASLDLTITGTGAGLFDVLDISGDILLDGIALVTFDGFTPSLSDSFEVVTAGNVIGTFDDVTVVSNGGITMSASYTSNSVTLTVDSLAIPGDVNGDGAVNDDDIVDFIAGWLHMQEAGDINSLRKGDLNQDGITNLFDWQILRANYTGSGSLNLADYLASTEIPEPTSVALVLLGLGVAGPFCRRTLRVRSRMNKCVLTAQAIGEHK